MTLIVAKAIVVVTYMFVDIESTNNCWAWDWYRACTVDNLVLKSYIALLPFIGSIGSF